MAAIGINYSTCPTPKLHLSRNLLDVIGKSIFGLVGKTSNLKIERAHHRRHKTQKTCKSEDSPALLYRDKFYFRYLLFWEFT